MYDAEYLGGSRWQPQDQKHQERFLLPDHSWLVREDHELQIPGVMAVAASGMSIKWKWVIAAVILGLISGYCLLMPPRQLPAPSAPASPVVAVEPPTPPAGDPPPGESAKPMVVDLGAGRFSIGALTFDSHTREITIPAAVNMREGAVEYLLVSRGGKVHESVFVTDVDPRDIHVAALLLGMKPQPDLGSGSSTAVVRGKGAVVISVEWDRNGPPERIFLNETVNLSDPSTGVASGTLPAGAWLYNGSRIESDGVFAATRHGSIISIIRDDDSLMNNPGASRDNDEIHTPNAAKLPNKDHPVRILVQVR